jgi:uncharacterized phage protein gp47/JayE
VSETLSYGLGAGGFVRMRLPEIRRAIFDDLRTRTGQTFDETPDSLTGQFVSIFAEREAAIWELAEAVYLSAFPATAQGVALDYAVSYAGVIRIQPSFSAARLLFYGDQGTVVQVGSVIESTYLEPGSPSLARFELPADVTITRDNAADLLLIVPAPVAAGSSYTVMWNGLGATYVAETGDSATDVVNALAADLIVLGATVSASSDRFRITSLTSFTTEWSASLTLGELGSPGTVLALEQGAVAAPAGSLTTIVTPTSGWNAVRQPAAASLGTLLETDEDLRARYATGVYRLGAATLPSIKANLEQDIRGVSSLAVYENSTSATDTDGRPPHSIEVVIEGGDSGDIAARIFALKAAGITAYGNTSAVALDDTGFPHPIGFSRPEPQLVWLKAVLTTTNEETVPGDVAERARQAMVAAGNDLGVGEDVLLQRIAAAVFAATTGVARVALTAVVSDTTPAPGDYTSTDITIGPRERAAFSAARTQVS